MANTLHRISFASVGQFCLYGCPPLGMAAFGTLACCVLLPNILPITAFITRNNYPQHIFTTYNVDGKWKSNEIESRQNLQVPAEIISLSYG